MGEGDDQIDALFGPDGTGEADPAGVARPPAVEQPGQGVPDAATRPAAPPGVRPAAPSHKIVISEPRTAPTAAASAETPIMTYRPRVEAEPSILGLSRHTRGRVGSRLFNLFFTAVFVVIFVQMVVALLRG
ncbi:hypothetical protein ACFQE5_17245 [Pseudonocardia hispaniensis]|uniref:Uncharacterized protein n=1 Tax=Pseudonocardia hispaniensis TaxID=904933 RepID=A0ABW1J557_9PSEU